MTSSAWLGSMTVNRGRIEKKYGAFWVNASENTRAPSNGPTSGHRAGLLPQGEDLAHAAMLLTGRHRLAGP